MEAPADASVVRRRRELERVEIDERGLKWARTSRRLESGPLGTVEEEEAEQEDEVGSDVPSRFVSCPAGRASSKTVETLRAGEPLGLWGARAA